jgi:uroporphyrinogen decarboxylase
VQSHRWPSPDWFDYGDVAEQCRRYEAYARIGGGWGAVFGDAYRLQGLETFLINLFDRPEVAQAIIDHVEQFYAHVNERILDAANGGLDVFYFGNDFGTQRALLVSPSIYRRFFAPAIGRLTSQAKSAGLDVMFHSCGSVRPLLPDFVAAGIDILDPVQAAAEGMDPLGIKAEMGSRLCLHGGVDTQRLLPSGTPADVADRVRLLCDVVGAGGGFILAPDQLLQSDVPPSNVLALYGAVC